MKYKDGSGREYILIDDTLVDALFYFSIALTVALSLLALVLTRLP